MAPRLRALLRRGLAGRLEEAERGRLLAGVRGARVEGVDLVLLDHESLSRSARRARVSRMAVAAGESPSRAATSFTARPSR